MKTSPNELRNELSRYSLSLLVIKKRLYFLRELEKQLSQYKEKSGLVKLKNIHLYEMCNDTYSMLVIDLCSFCTHFAEDGGFIRRLNNYLAKFRPKNPKKIPAGKTRIFSSSDLSLEQMKEIQHEIQYEEQVRLAKVTQEALNSLFPDWAKKGKVEQCDVELLRKRFIEAVRKIDTDRNIHKAHRFEKESIKKSKTLLPISLKEIEKAFNTIENLLKQLWMIAELASYNFDTDLGSHTKRTAQDLIDLTIHGSINNLIAFVGISTALQASNSEQKFYWQFREQINDQSPDDFSNTKQE